MAEQGDALCGAPEEPSPGVTLSDSLVTSRTRSAGPLPSCTIRLDRENISRIGISQRLEMIHSLYLQQNQIEKIENLEHFPNLRFLCLAGNRIQRLEKLQGLSQLGVLDLSHNLIRLLDTEELPRSLRILDLTGNQCTQQHGYRDGVLAALPRLLQLDSQPVHGHAAEEEAGGGSCSSEEEEEEEEELLPERRGPFAADKGFLVDLQRELAGRARLRRTLSLEEHRARLQELRERRALLLGPGQHSAARPRPQLCPQGDPGAQPPPLPASSGSQAAPGAVRPPGEALEEETRAEGAGGGQLSQISCTSSQE